MGADRRCDGMVALVTGSSRGLGKAIAARLQVSERTVQRHVRMLLAKVGARNRMQLGQILACRSHPHPSPQPEQLTENDMSDSCVATLSSSNKRQRSG